MKFNKLTIGLGAVAATMLVSCDKAADQEYTPAPSVAVPAAYFSLDYDGDVVIDENQTSFTVPVCRANSAGDLSVNVSCEVNGTYFMVENKQLNVNGDSSNGTVPVSFKDGEDVAEITVSYDWDTMNANAGKEYVFKFTLDGESSDYYATEVECSAMYVPWTNIVGPNGETTGTFVDELVYSGWGVDAPFEYDVEIQYNPVSEGIYRINTPYANCPAAPAGNQQMQYHGPETGNYMYLNAQDPSNVYLCDKKGAPKPEYDTYYTIDMSYGDVSYFDRAAAVLKGELYLGTVNPAGYAPGKLETQKSGGQVYNNYIHFPEQHFYVHFADNDLHGGALLILFPGGQGKTDWEDLGTATFTEGLISCANGDQTLTYEVPIQRHADTPELFRLVNPYTNYWPAGNPQDEDFDIEFDCTDKNFVIVTPQTTGNWVSSGRNDYEAQITNAAILYTELVSKKKQKTKEQIIAEGLNDTFNETEINLPNATVLYVDGETFIDYKIASENGWTGCKITLPEASKAPANYAVSAARNKAKGLTYTRKTIKSVRNIKPAIRLFDQPFQGK